MNINSERAIVIELLNLTRNEKKITIGSEEFWKNLGTIREKVLKIPVLIDQGFVGQFLTLAKITSPLKVKIFFLEFLDQVTGICTVEQFRNEKIGILNTIVFALMNLLAPQTTSSDDIDEYTLITELMRKRISLFTKLYAPCLNYICVSSSVETIFWKNVKKLKEKFLSTSGISSPEFSIKCWSIRFIAEVLSCCFEHDENYRVYIIRRGESNWSWVKPKHEFAEFHIGKLPSKFRRSSNSLKEFSHPDFLAEGKMLVDVLKGMLKKCTPGLCSVILNCLFNVAKRREKANIQLVDVFLKYDEFLSELSVEENTTQYKNEMKGINLQLKYILLYCFECPALSLPFYDKLCEKLRERFSIREDYLVSMKRTLQQGTRPRFEIEEHSRKRKREDHVEETEEIEEQPHPGISSIIPPQDQEQPVEESGQKRVKLQLINTPLGPKTPIQLADIVMSSILNLRTGSAPPNTPAPTSDNLINLIMGMFQGFHPQQYQLIKQFITVKTNNSAALLKEKMKGEETEKLTEVEDSADGENRMEVREKVIRWKPEKKDSLHNPNLNSSFDVEKGKLSNEENLSLYEHLWDSLLSQSLESEGTSSVRRSLICQHVLSYIHGAPKSDDPRSFAKFLLFLTQNSQAFMLNFDLLIQVMFSEFLNRKEKYEEFFMFCLNYILKTSFIQTTTSQGSAVGSDQKGLYLERLFVESPQIPEKSFRYLEMLLLQKGYTKIGLDVIIAIWKIKKRWSLKCLTCLLSHCSSAYDYVRLLCIPTVANQIYCTSRKSLLSTDDSMKDEEVEFNLEEQKNRSLIEKYALDKMNVLMQPCLYSMKEDRVKVEKEQEKMNDEEEEIEGEGEDDEEEKMVDEEVDEKNEENDEEKKVKEEEEEEEEQMEEVEWTESFVSQYSGLYFSIVTRNMNLFNDYVILIQSVLEKSYHDVKLVLFQKQLSRLIIRLGLNSDVLYNTLLYCCGKLEEKAWKMEEEYNNKLIFHLLSKTITSRSQEPEKRFLKLFRDFVYLEYLDFSHYGVQILSLLVNFLNKDDIFKELEIKKNFPIKPIIADRETEKMEDEETEKLVLDKITKIKVAPIWFYLLLYVGDEGIEKFVDSLLEQESRSIGSVSKLFSQPKKFGGIKIQMLDDTDVTKISLGNDSSESSKEENKVDEEENLKFVKSEDLLVDINKFSLKIEKLYDSGSDNISEKMEQERVEEILRLLVRRILKKQSFTSNSIRRVLVETMESDYFKNDNDVPQTFLMIVFYAAMVYLDLREFTINEVLRKLLRIETVWENKSLYEGILVCFTKELLWEKLLKVLIEECSNDKIKRIIESVKKRDDKVGMYASFTKFMNVTIRNYQMDQANWVKLSEEKKKFLKIVGTLF